MLIRLQEIATEFKKSFLLIKKKTTTFTTQKNSQDCSLQKVNIPNFSERH